MRVAYPKHKGTFQLQERAQVCRELGEMSPAQMDSYAATMQHPTPRELELMGEINTLRRQLMDTAHRELAKRLATAPTLPMMALSPPPNPLDQMVSDKWRALGHEQGPSAAASATAVPERKERVIHCQDQYDPDV